jgi:uncharacterized protein YecE (DUF72 family)
VILIGTAGWGIAARHAAQFPGSGSHLERYGQVLRAAEIDTSFYRHHRRATYARWADSVPADFRFAVKTPRALTQPGSVILVPEVLDRFADEVSGLGERLGVALLQFAPSVAFDPAAAAALFTRVRASLPARIACEPRHASWDSAPAQGLLREMNIARVAADPPRWPGGELPGGDGACAYFRMHGAPRIYYSDYDAARLQALAAQLSACALTARDVWCIMDNTALGHALANALTLKARLAV